MQRQLRDYSMVLILQICKQRIWTLMLKSTSRNGKRKFVSKHIETGNGKVTNEKLVFQGLSNLKLQTSRANCKSWKSVVNSYFSSILPVHKHGSKFCLSPMYNLEHNTQKHTSTYEKWPIKRDKKIYDVQQKLILMQKNFQSVYICIALLKNKKERKIKEKKILLIRFETETYQPSSTDL